MKDKQKTSIGFRFAFNGIKEAFIKERNFRIHLYITSIVLILSFYVQLNMMEWLFIIIAIYFVLVMELVNSLFERIIDYIKPEYHIQAKIIKDIAAGVVLLTATLSIIIGLIIFLPKFF